jgi:glyoxylase-like metal-dependent hydrolase (beta-lactamase superfamily II)
LIGHAHYDHILDAPEVCKQTGARLIGSKATLMYGRSAGLSESRGGSGNLNNTYK